MTDATLISPPYPRRLRPQFSGARRRPASLQSSILPWTGWLLALALPAIAAAQDRSPPLVTVTIAPVDRLLESVDLIASLTGREGIRPVVDKGLERAGQLAGLDRTRPLRLFLFLNPGQPNEPDVVLQLPIDQRDQLIETLQKVPAATLQPTADGAWTLQTPDRTFTLRAVERDLFIATRDEQSLLTRVSSPENERLVDDVSLRLNMAAVPPLLLDVGLAKFDADIERDLPKKESESDEEYAIRSAVLAGIRDVVHTVLRDTSHLTAAMKLGARSRVHLTWNARGGSDLASDLAALALPQAEWSTVGDETAFSGRVALGIPPRVQGLLEEIFRQLRSQVRREIGKQLDKVDRHPAAGVFDAVESTLATGKYQAVFEFVPNNDGYMTFFSGTRMEETERLAESMRTVLPYAVRTDDVQSVDLNVSESPERAIHRLKPREVRPRDQKIYGPDPSVWLGTTPREFLFAIGTGGTESLLQRTELTAVENPPLVELSWSFRDWIELAARHRPDGRGLRRLQAAFPTGEDDDAQLKITRTGDSLQWTMEFEAGYVRLLDRSLPPRD